MSDIFETLKEIFRTELADPTLDIGPGSELAAIPGWDSVNLSCVILGVEKRFGLVFTPAQMDRLDTVGDFIGVIQESGAR